MSITTVDRDVIEAHILTKLDGITLINCAAASPILRTLCTEEKLWKDICTATWPSVNDARVRHVISTFPSGYRSFFSDSSTATTFNRPPPRHHHDVEPLLLTSSEFISVVDISYKNKIIYSKVEVTKEFWKNSCKVDYKNPVKFKADDDEFFKDLEESMNLSWIIIDPIQKRSVNLSSQKPIFVQQIYESNEVQLLYVAVLPGYTRVGSTDPVQCRITVTCEGGEEGGEMHVREVNMQIQDMDGINLSGEGILVIIQEAIHSERTKQGQGRQIFDKFLKMKKERKERIERRDYILDVICIIIRALIFCTLVCGVLFY